MEHLNTGIWCRIEPIAGGAVGVPVDQGDSLLQRAAELSHQIGGQRTFANPAFLTSNQNLECHFANSKFD